MRAVAVHYEMWTQYPSLWFRLAFRQVSYGDDVRQLLQSNPPHHRTEFGAYGAFVWTKESVGYKVSALQLVTRNSKAISCLATCFGESMTLFGEVDQKQFYNEFEKHRQSLRAIH